MAIRTNYCTNPGCTGAVADNVPAGYSRSGNQVAPLTVARVAGTYSPYAYHVTGNTETGKFWTLDQNMAPNFVAGEYETMSVVCYGSQVPADFGLHLQTWDAGWGTGAVTSVNLSTGAMTRWAVTKLMPAACQNHLTRIGKGAAWAASGAVDLYLEMVQIEKSAVPTPYFDGSYTFCHWAGPANASASVSSGLTVAPTQLLRPKFMPQGRVICNG